MNRRRIASLVVSAALCGCVLVGVGAQDGPPERGMPPHHGFGPGGPGHGPDDFDRPVGPGEFRRVADLLRSQGNDELADKLMEAMPEFPEGGELPRRAEGPEGEFRRAERGEEREGERSLGPAETFMRVRGVHERLTSLERRRADIERREAEKEIDPEDAARQREEYRAELGKWASEARGSLPQVQRRMRAGLDELERRTGDDRPAFRAFGESVRANMDDFNAFLENPPESDQELADGLRERLGKMMGSLPREKFAMGAAMAEEKRSAHIRREIELLRKRLDALESELEVVVIPPQAPDAPGAPQAPESPQAPMEKPRDKAPEGQRRRAPLPPLPPQETK